MKTKLITLIAAALLTPASIFAFDATSEQVAISNKVVPEMIASGHLKVEKPACKAWISPMLWAVLDFDGKANCAAAIAVYCSAHKPVATIYDAQSAKKIAKWGWAKGLEIIK